VELESTIKVENRPQRRTLLGKVKDIFDVSSLAESLLRFAKQLRTKGPLGLEQTTWGQPRAAVSAWFGRALGQNPTHSNHI